MCPGPTEICIKFSSGLLFSFSGIFFKRKNWMCVEREKVIQKSFCLVVVFRLYLFLKQEPQFLNESFRIRRKQMLTVQDWLSSCPLEVVPHAQQWHAHRQWEALKSGSTVQSLMQYKQLLLQGVISWECWTMAGHWIFVKFFLGLSYRHGAAKQQSWGWPKPFSVYHATELPEKCIHLEFWMKGKWKHGAKNTWKKTEKSSVTNKHSFFEP